MTSATTTVPLSSTTTPTTAITWLDLVQAEVERLSLDPQVYHVLCAFGGPRYAPGPVSLDLNSGQDDNDDDAMARDMCASLTGEIDADQARMFARRFVSVSQLLLQRRDNDRNNNDTTLQLLRLGLFRRAQQILTHDPPPRALRIRALVDFLWSQAVVLGNAVQWQHGPSVQALVQAHMNGFVDFAPGCAHVTIQGATSSGPVHLNILRIRPGAAVLHTLDARGSGHANLAALAQHHHDAVAAISGGFFLYSEPDIRPPCRRTDPVGLLVTHGVVHQPPVFSRATLYQTTDDTSSFRIDTVGMQGVQIQLTQATVLHTSHNTTDLPLLLECTVGVHGVDVRHRGHDKTATLDTDQVGISIVGRQVVEIYLPHDTSTETMSTTTITTRTMSIPLAGFVLLLPVSLVAKTASTVLKDVAPTRFLVSYTLPIPGIQSAMAGGPILYSADETLPALDLPAEDFCGSAPPVTFSQDETFDRNLLPRMGAGVTADGTLMLMAVDGRNLDQALGLTLQGTADLLKYLGCIRAMNLDGGSSKRMYVRGKGVVCLSTTEIKANNKTDVKNGKDQEESSPSAVEPQRPVHSAILFLPPGKSDP